MIRRFLAIVRSRLAFPSPAVPSCWDLCRDYMAIHPSTIIDPTAHMKLFNPPSPAAVRVRMGEGSHVFANLSTLRPDATITIGKRCQIGASTIIAADSIEIGDDVLMAWGITLMDTDAHSLVWEERKNDATQCYRDYLEDRENFIRNKDWSHVPTGPIRIGDKVWIGFNAAVLKGVTIGPRSVIGACSVVTRDVPPDSVVSGNPARIVQRIDNGSL